MAIPRESTFDGYEGLPAEPSVPGAKTSGAMKGVVRWHAGPTPDDCESVDLMACLASPKSLSFRRQGRVPSRK